MYLGIDLGTSRLKASLIDSDGLCRAEVVDSMPKLDINARLDVQTWLRGSIVRCLDHLFAGGSPAPTEVRGIAVSGGAPSGVLMDGSGETAELAMLYSDPTPFSAPYHQGTLDARLEMRRARCDYWSDSWVSPNWQSGNCRHVLPLHSYAVWLLTGFLSCDTIAAYELGVQPRATTDPMIYSSRGDGDLTLPRVHAPSEIVGEVRNFAMLPDGIPVCCGTTDTVCSALGSGIRERNGVMIYYGSYGVVHQEHFTMAELIGAQALDSPPYSALLVHPRAGLLIERISSLMKFDGGDNGEFPVDRAAAKALRDGLPRPVPFLALPPSTTVGPGMPPEALFAGLTLTTCGEDVAVGLLSGLGLTMCSAGVPAALADVPIYAAGGGSNSQPWVRLTTEITTLAQHMHPSRVGARGTAQLARSAVMGTSLPDCGAEECSIMASTGQWSRQLGPSYLERFQKYS
jgi:sugar (pentulose or hexulose) kinase